MSRSQWQGPGHHYPTGVAAPRLAKGEEHAALGQGVACRKSAVPRDDRVPLLAHLVLPDSSTGGVL